MSQAEHRPTFLRLLPAPDQSTGRSPTVPARSLRSSRLISCLSQAETSSHIPTAVSCTLPEHMASSYGASAKHEDFSV
eukprot:3689321-Pyramimonas_sp.AAC.1